MALDATTLARIREWVGSTPSDSTVEATFALTGNGTVEACALSILRVRYADLIGGPSQFDVQGDYSQSTAKNIDALAAKISQLEAMVGTGGTVLQTGYMRRCASR